MATACAAMIALNLLPKVAVGDSTDFESALRFVDLDHDPLLPLVCWQLLPLVCLAQSVQGPTTCRKNLNRRGASGAPAMLRWLDGHLLREQRLGCLEDVIRVASFQS